MTTVSAGTSYELMFLTQLFAPRLTLEATLAVAVVVLVLALWFPITALAKAASTILLVVFARVNFSLWWIKRRESAPPKEGPDYPIWLPMAGCLVCAAFLIFHAIIIFAS